MSIIFMVLVHQPINSMILPIILDVKLIYKLRSFPLISHSHVIISLCLIFLCLIVMEPKRIWGSTSLNDWFWSKVEVSSYVYFKTYGITNFRLLDQTKLSLHIFVQFIHSTLLTLITINFSYHSNFIFEFIL